MSVAAIQLVRRRQFSSLCAVSISVVTVLYRVCTVQTLAVCFFTYFPSFVSVFLRIRLLMYPFVNIVPVVYSSVQVSLRFVHLFVSYRYCCCYPTFVNLIPVKLPRFSTFRWWLRCKHCYDYYTVYYCYNNNKLYYGADRCSKVYDVFVFPASLCSSDEYIVIV